MSFDPPLYGPDVKRILSLGENRNRLIPLQFAPYAAAEVRDLMNTFEPDQLFPDLEEPEVPLAGLWLYFACFEEAHRLAEKCETEEGDLWHAPVHRNCAGTYPIFANIERAAGTRLLSWASATELANNPAHFKGGWQWRFSAPSGRFSSITPRAPNETSLLAGDP